MKKRKIILGFVCFLMLFTLTGCGSKTVLTSETFKSISTENNLEVQNANVSNNAITETIIAKSSNSWQVEFYILTDESNAISMFNTNKTTFETYEETSSSTSSVNMGNYSSYSLTSGGYYMYICRVENTMIYLRVDESYKDDVKDFIDKLGY